jgi:hypothetical protein
MTVFNLGNSYATYVSFTCKFLCRFFCGFFEYKKHGIPRDGGRGLSSPWFPFIEIESITQPCV